MAKYRLAICYATVGPSLIHHTNEISEEHSPHGPHFLLAKPFFRLLPHIVSKPGQTEIIAMHCRYAMTSISRNLRMLAV